MFDTVLIPVDFVLDSESVTKTDGLYPRRFVDEKACVVDAKVLAEVVKKQIDPRPCSRRKQPGVQQAVGCRIDDSVQPASLVVRLDHGFIDRDVIWIGSIARL